ncbi:MAG: NAD-dependent epimerase [Chlorobiaceae bacterium]|nr:NAD-dependent epimerase [Chlorobiaceae bacterium]
MKKVLITGENSYIGLSFIEWVKNNHLKNYSVDTISLRDRTWETKDFSTYDTVIHLAAIVHSPLTPSSLYYEVNRDLTVELAKKVKEQGVKHFIFFSSLSVYGLRNGEINQFTKPLPLDDYGKSKFEAEQELTELETQTFKLSIVRPPIVYGPRCPGNFSRLLRLFYYLPILPKLNNKRSMIFIDNLSDFLHVMIQHQITGTYIPQNEKYVSTISIFREFRKSKGKITILTPLLLPSSLIKKNSILNKLFSDLTVDKNMSALPTTYQKVSFEESIIISGEAYINNGQ